jgi:hypothetical protein
MLVAELLLFLGISETDLRGRRGVGDRPFADAPATHEDLGLKQFFAFACFALHVVDGVAVFNVGIKSENHGRFVIGQSDDWAIENPKAP